MIPPRTASTFLVPGRPAIDSGLPSGPNMLEPQLVRFGHAVFVPPIQKHTNIMTQTAGFAKRKTAIAEARLISTDIHTVKSMCLTPHRFLASCKD
jgi:hypothetical protein